MVVETASTDLQISHEVSLLAVANCKAQLEIESEHKAAVWTGTKDTLDLFAATHSALSPVTGQSE